MIGNFMCLSMTGWGKGTTKNENHMIAVEVRSVNHRYFEVNFKASRILASLEPLIREAVRARFDRGKFDVSVTISGEASASHKAQVNLDVAERYISGLKSLKEKFGLPGEITLESLTRIREIFLAEENGSLEDISFENIQQALEDALDNLEEMRRKEGKALFKDVSSRINEADSLVDQIKEKVPATVEEYRGRLRIRLDELLDADPQLNPGRLEQEIVFLTQRSDTSEEIIRLKSHFAQFRDQLNINGPAGRKLDFLLQEMHREANTVGSKALDTRVSALVIDLKGILEKVREQVQNLE